MDPAQFGPTRGAAQNGACRQPRAAARLDGFGKGHRARTAARKTLRRVKQEAVMDRHRTVFRALSDKEAAQTTVAPCWQGGATRRTCIRGSRRSNGRSGRSRCAPAPLKSPRDEKNAAGRGGGVMMVEPDDPCVAFGANRSYNTCPSSTRGVVTRRRDGHCWRHERRRRDPWGLLRGAGTCRRHRVDQDVDGPNSARPDTGRVECSLSQLSEH